MNKKVKIFIGFIIGALVGFYLEPLIIKVIQKVYNVDVSIEVYYHYVRNSSMLILGTSTLLFIIIDGKYKIIDFLIFLFTQVVVISIVFILYVYLKPYIILTYVTDINSIYGEDFIKFKDLSYFKNVFIGIILSAINTFSIKCMLKKLK